MLVALFASTCLCVPATLHDVAVVPLVGIQASFASLLEALRGPILIVAKSPESAKIAARAAASEASAEIDAGLLKEQ